MDMSAIIVVVGMTVLFFGFIVWMEIYSRKKNRENLSADSPEINFSETKKKTNNF